MTEPKDWDDLRHEVREFALLMEKTLRTHDDKKGHTSWKRDSVASLAVRVREEADELYAEAYIPTYKVNYSRVIAEAVDVANMAMMVVDVSGGLPCVPSSAEKLKNAKAEAVREQFQALTHENRTLKNQLKTVSASREDVWFWQGDGHDDPASLACPVVMQPHTLNDILDRLSVAEWDAREANKAYDAVVEKHIPPAKKHPNCEHHGGRAFHQCWCKLDCSCRSDLCQPKDKEDIKRIKNYWLFRKGNEDVPGSRWIGGHACRPINPQPHMLGAWAKGERCPDRVQDSDDPKDEIKAIRRTIAWLVKKVMDAEALAQDISVQDDTDT